MIRKLKNNFIENNTALIITLFSVFTFSLVSCSSVDSEKNEESVKKTEEKASKKTSPRHQEKAGRRESMTEEVVTPKETPIGTEAKLDQIIPKSTAGKEPEATGRPASFFYEKYLKGTEDKLKKVSLNLDAAPLSEIIPVFQQELSFNYIIDPDVKGAITISLDAEMTKHELWQMFEQILWLAGAYCSPEGELLHIFPFAKMPRERRIFAKHDPLANVEVRILRVHNTASKNIIEEIKPFLTEGAMSTDLTDRNSILLVDAPENIDKIETLLGILDKKEKPTWPRAVIPCVNVSSLYIKDELAAILPVLGFPVTVDNVVAEPGSIHLTTLERLEVIIASAANNEALEELKKWVSILDRSDVGEQERVFVYKVINSTAGELLQAVSSIFSIEGTIMSSGSKTTSTDTAAGSTSEATAAKTSISKAVSKSDKDSHPTSIFEVPAKIFADDKNNRLILRTAPRTYAMIKALLNRLDTVPGQVLLQVTVVEINLSENTEYGIEYSALDKRGDATSSYGTNYTDLDSSDATSTGFKYWIRNPNEPDDRFAYIRALAGKDNTKVLSCPQIIATSHTQATIQVGDKVPIVTSENTDTSSSTTINRSIEYQDTGIILTITPHITEGGLISLELEQTVSDATTTTTSNIDSPTIQERQLKTSLSIRDRDTLIVGGLIREKRVDDNDNLPFISKIPILSAFTGFTDIETTRVELLVLITGTIVTEKTDLQEMIERYKQSVKMIDDFEKNEE